MKTKSKKPDPKATNKSAEKPFSKRDKKDWRYRGKTIKQLIQELQTFENLNLEVRISVDDMETDRPISLVAKDGKRCMLMYFG